MAGLTFVEKLGLASDAIGSLDNGISIWNGLGLFQNGGGRRNHITIKNSTDENFDLISYYIHWGYCRVPPGPIIPKKDGDVMLFINAGSWAATGSSGLVQWELPSTNCGEKQYLIVLWDAPFNFNHSDNFFGMWISDSAKQGEGSKNINIKDTNVGWQVFKEMYQDLAPKDCVLNDSHGLPNKSEAGSSYHLVCCGPGKYNAKANWGYREPCYVKNEKYEIKAMTGDRHHGETNINISYVKKEECSKKLS